MNRKNCVKKVNVLLLALLLACGMAACGGSGASGDGEGGSASSYAEAVDVLNTVWETYAEADQFAIAGGDQENMVMDAPGKFDVSKTEELDYTLGLPESQASAIDDAASMVHMMNSNTFTGAAYRLKSGTDMETFVEDVKTNILNRQWMCGFPDTLLVINVDGSYVITAFGEAEIMETFKNNALSALDGAEVLVEEPVL